MRTSTILVGLIFAALVAAVLAPPLYVVLPGTFLPDSWYTVGAPLSALGYVAALAVLAAAGALAARFDRNESVRSAAGAGAIAGLLGGALVAAPASTIQACGDLLASDVTAMSEGEVLPLMAGAILSASWLPFSVAVAMALVGPALGAMGGAALDMYLGVGARRAVRLVHRSSVPQWGLTTIALAMIVESAFSAELDLVLWRNLTGGPPTGTDALGLAAPVVAGGIASTFLLGWAMRDVALLWRSRLKFFAILWGGTAVGWAATGAVGAALVHEALLTTVVPWGIGLLYLVATTVGLVAGSRPTVSFETHPRTAGEFFGQGVLVGIVVTTGVLLVGIAPISATYRLVFPVYRYVLNGAAELPALWGADAVHRVYLDHLYATPAIPMVALVYLVLAWPFWMLVRLYSAR